MKYIISLLCGTLFGIGLAASGMTNTEKVIGFLDITGDWQIDLLLVMASALMVFSLSFHFIKKRSRPILSTTFDLPTIIVINKPLILGAIIFGIGWGLVGYCPGPAIASLFYGQLETVIFLCAMLSGMFLFDKIKW